MLVQIVLCSVHISLVILYTVHTQATSDQSCVSTKENISDLICGHFFQGNYLQVRVRLNLWRKSAAPRCVILNCEIIGGSSLENQSKLGKSQGARGAGKGRQEGPSAISCDQSLRYRLQSHLENLIILSIGLAMYCMGINLGMNGFWFVVQ